MALSANQRKILRFAEKGFGDITGVRIEKDGMHYDESKHCGIQSVGVGECFWYYEVGQGVRTNISLTRYNKECGGALREMNLRFKPAPEKYEIPSVRIRLTPMHTSVDSLVQDLEFARKAVDNVGNRSSRKFYDTFQTVRDAMNVCFRPGDFERRVDRLQANTYVGKFHNGRSGIYITVPYEGLAGHQFVQLRNVAQTAIQTLDTLIQAAD